ncbi:hypothetical protein BFP97_00825 [Roseivirga sp. 4D4]|uniref:hypothetical protein n=1 Tax=Roseivirga sp. 4D4 TaxID=1889784 RepID=UPI0008531EDA|nr:hypothetical protein [Roseivirga sp. 4D4]OEK00146.1 hypothetical protein BFP97_00825 [Roseivirga sp. 4D4]
MKSRKVHSYNGKKAYYAKFGRKWVVEENGEEEEFVNIEAMIDKYPELLNVGAINLSFEKRKFAREEVLPPPVVRETEIHTKSVTCYYCSGSGEIVGGVPCPNCNGKGTFVVSDRGLG